MDDRSSMRFTLDGRVTTDVVSTLLNPACSRVSFISENGLFAGTRMYIFAFYYLEILFLYYRLRVTNGPN